MGSKNTNAGGQVLPRLSNTERVVLDMLRDAELFGLQFTERSNGSLKRGTVYVTLGRMRDKGYVTSRVEAQPPGAIGLPRRWYRPTAHGLRVREAWTIAERWYVAGNEEAGAA